MHVYVKIIAVCVVVCCIFFRDSETAQSRQPIPPVLDRVIYPEEDDFPDNYHYQQHVHPQDEDYDDEPSQKPANKSIDDAISTIWDTREKNQTSIDSNRIPLSFINEINNKEFTVNDLLLHYVDGYQFDLESRFQDQEERSGPVLTPVKEAQCMPELRTVALIEEMDKDPTALYIPSCIRIERCGGCCMHNLLACQPTKIETINVKLIKVKYVNGAGKKLRYPEKEIKSIDKHLSCKCGCRIKAEDCTSAQIYDENKCRCICRNIDEEKKCLKENSTKLWSPDACACQCREELKCTTGSLFDWRECKCIVKQVRRRNVRLARRHSYRNNPMSVIPLSDNF